MSQSLRQGAVGRERVDWNFQGIAIENYGKSGEIMKNKVLDRIS